MNQRKGKADMPVDFGSFEFACPPEMGEAWIVKACKLAGLGGEIGKQDVHQPFDKGQGKTLRVSMVRHPCDWLSDVYASFRRGNCSGNGQLDRLWKLFLGMENEMFDCFVEDYLNLMPGEVNDVFGRYKCDTRMKSEDMPWALVELLDSCGVSEEECNKIKTLWPTIEQMNVERKWQPDVFQAVLEAEDELCLDFDYY